MNFLESFKKIPHFKTQTKSKTVSSVPNYDNIFMFELNSILRNYIQTHDIVVRPSVGQGNYAQIPWVCLLSSNPAISTGPQKGIYIVLLFTEKGDEFYLSLNQGVTNFMNMRLPVKEMNKAIKDSVNYFRKELDKKLITNYGFTFDPIKLANVSGKLAKGYTDANIISKKFDIETFDNQEFMKDLDALMFEYNEIITHIGGKTYDDVLQLIINPITLEDLDEALESLQIALAEETLETRDIPRVLVEVEKGRERISRYDRISDEKIYKKVDYLKQAKEQHKIGLIGEKLALEYERKRLLDLYLDPNEHIVWRSVQSDSYGYDFESVDYKNGKLIKIYIEVKATKNLKDTPFFVSRNELFVSKEKKDKYRVFRIFDITSISPKYYLADGEIEDNFYLDPVTYSARYKYEVI